MLLGKNFGEGSWWGWLDSNQLNVEVTDLQSAVPHQLHRIPVAGMDQYRQLLDDVDVDDELLVCAVGIEPTTSCAQDTRATTALRTEVIGGTWSRVFMMSRIVNLKIRTVNLKGLRLSEASDSSNHLPSELTTVGRPVRVVFLIAICMVLVVT